MNVRFALACIFAFGWISSTFALDASGALPTGQSLSQKAGSADGSRIGQADTSRKCADGFYWTCSKFGCWCQQKGQVY